MKRTLSCLIVAAMGITFCASGLPVAASAAEKTAAGTPYDESGTYDVSVEHVVVNQVFGASNDAEAVSHSFIELYNPTDASVSLEGWQVCYKSSPDGGDDSWRTLTLAGSIDAEGYFLIRCGEVDKVSSGAYLIPEGDMEWDVSLHNKGLTVALFDRQVSLTDAFTGAVADENRPAGYVDALAAQGNDTEEAQIPPVYEGGYADIQSKKKAILRNDHADNDNNAEDAAALDYTEVTPEEYPVQNSRGETISAQASYTVKEDGFTSDAVLSVQKTDGIKLGDANADGGVAEIVAYNSDNGKAYVVNGAQSLLNVFDVAEDGSFGSAEEIDIAQRMQAEDETFVYGDMTSVAVDPEHDRIAVALQDADYTKSGRVAVLNYDNEIIAIYTTGVQPDMITFTEDGRYILTADEGEPRMGYGTGAEDPAGSVTVIDTQATENAVKIATFDSFSASELAAKGVVLNDPDGDGISLSAAEDLEPEYIAVKNMTAYVALQEANAIGVLDIAAGQFTAVEPLGFKDYSLEENAIDLDDSDGAYLPKTYEDTYGVYMPDGISVYEADGKTYLLTANEGDAREWGDFTDEEKRTLVSADGTVTAEKVRVLNNTVKTGIGEGSYLYGARSFSIFEVGAEGLSLVYDSANDFESMTWEFLPEYYNASNDDVELESRTAKKGTEPEAVTIASISGKTYAFIALERIGGIMIYDITDPAAATYINYVNTRDFNGATEGDVAPEGLAVIENGDNAYLLAAFEVSGTVACYEVAAQTQPNPEPEPDPEPEPEPEPEPDPEEDDGSISDGAENDGMTGWIVGGCIAVVVAIGIVVAVVLMRKKK